jgi:hypothetical protein
MVFSVILEIFAINDREKSGSATADCMGCAGNRFGIWEDSFWQTIVVRTFRGRTYGFCEATGFTGCGWCGGRND